jgi:hypothetical protein
MVIGEFRIVSAGAYGGGGWMGNDGARARLNFAGGIGRGFDGVLWDSMIELSRGFLSRTMGLLRYRGYPSFAKMNDFERIMSMATGGKVSMGGREILSQCSILPWMGRQIELW